jgi:alkylation response protein AidB-like acyl-CoA dehydrogenase
VQVSAECYALVTEPARGWMSLAGAMGGHTVVAKLLLAYGTQAQKDKYLPRWRPHFGVTYIAGNASCLFRMDEEID